MGGHPYRGMSLFMWYSVPQLIFVFMLPCGINFLVCFHLFLTWEQENLRTQGKVRRKNRILRVSEDKNGRDSGKVLVL